MAKVKQSLEADLKAKTEEFDKYKRETRQRETDAATRNRASGEQLRKLKAELSSEQQHSAEIQSRMEAEQVAERNEKLQLQQALDDMAKTRQSLEADLKSALAAADSLSLSDSEPLKRICDADKQTHAQIAKKFWKYMRENTNWNTAVTSVNLDGNLSQLLGKKRIAKSEVQKALGAVMRGLPPA